MECYSFIKSYSKVYISSKYIFYNQHNLLFMKK